MIRPRLPPVPGVEMGILRSDMGVVNGSAVDARGVCWWGGKRVVVGGSCMSIILVTIEYDLLV